MKILIVFSGSFKKALNFCSAVGLQTRLFLKSIRPATKSDDSS